MTGGGRSVVLLVCVVAGPACLASVAAFDQDRVIYKWSPLWFNNHYRRANLYKRFREEPIQKWSPEYLSRPSHYHYKRDGSGCGRENSVCAFVSEASGRLVTARCCGALSCLPAGASWTCLDPTTPLSLDDLQPQLD
ncbi:uncharacterized protein [Procambarus clarkii]|uniref:uncharacterized protein n=1 Tax=Procambarus clarkii TaxID=6728 RepID=UPI001E674DE1|nr:uncharacterized protein LOC123770199 [Procambarus clarkii]